ncbi:hypothetical protein CERSUDRAFT_73334 [Gelatoporia subvermispora B]|uniref:Uncharacterized protein n=1 Tax=Ceriporiopsis subvermispora (strain B) TaxID=914234 RepID=M2QKC6_CERS8|nr:hypothetical protein CERSUDRAFT_73334 [Gelatoporia subvermispora B]
MIRQHQYMVQSGLAVVSTVTVLKTRLLNPSNEDDEKNTPLGQVFVTGAVAKAYSSYFMDSSRYHNLTRSSALPWKYLLKPLPARLLCVWVHKKELFLVCGHHGILEAILLHMSLEDLADLTAKDCLRPNKDKAKAAHMWMHIVSLSRFWSEDNLNPIFKLWPVIWWSAILADLTAENVNNKIKSDWPLVQQICQAQDIFNDFGIHLANNFLHSLGLWPGMPSHNLAENLTHAGYQMILGLTDYLYSKQNIINLNEHRKPGRCPVICGDDVDRPAKRPRVQKVRTKLNVDVAWWEQQTSQSASSESINDLEHLENISSEEEPFAKYH